MKVHGSSPPFKPWPCSFNERRGSTQSLPTEVENASSKKPTRTTAKSEPKQKTKGFFNDKFMHGVKEKDMVYLKVVQPGYTIAKRQSRVNVLLDMNKFWDHAPKSVKKSIPEHEERIRKLLNEIDDLKICLEEERINHKYQFQQFVDNTKINIQIMVQEHRDHIKMIEEQHLIDIENLKESCEAKLNKERELANSTSVKMQNEIDLVRASLESCKHDVSIELEKRWSERNEGLKSEQEVMIERLLTEQKSKLKREEVVAVNKVKGRHADDIKMIKEEHRKELNALRCEFEAFAADAEQYKILALESENLKEDMRDLQQLHEKTEQKLRKTLNELADVKLKLRGYEMSFSEKVAEVEERYAMKIQRLILNNTDLRHNYMKKCAELLGVQNKDDTTTNSKAMKVSDTKRTMKTIILARARADISLVTEKKNVIIGDLSSKASTTGTSSLSSRRPRSAPLVKSFGENDVDGNLFLTLSEFRKFRPSSSFA